MLSIKQQLKNLIEKSVQELNLGATTVFVVEHPDILLHGDYSTNVALVLGRQLKKNPLTLAIDLVGVIEKERQTNEELKKYIEKVEVAGIGFINFFLTLSFFEDSLKSISENDNFFQSDILKDKKISVEYTDPNPFKQFHIGHLMTNIIGESIARLYEANGAEVKRMCYQGDVGRHVALTIWALRFMDRPLPEESARLNEKTKFLGEAYALGSKKIKEEPEHEEEIKRINKKIYERSDEEVNEIYDKGREWSLEHFEEIYKVLGTQFDQYFFESKIAPVGLEIVHSHVGEVFEESEGAIVFKAEKYEGEGLHTRVFINKEGLPTYEAKELGLVKTKYEMYPADVAISITGNEQNDYFKVVLKAASLIYPDIASKIVHLSHGMLRFAEGKMSSRTGNVITGESLISDMKEAAHEVMKARELPEGEKDIIAEQVAVGALKYAILKQAIGKDIIFDKEKSLSFEGDSGPYLQYAHTRAQSILRKAEEQKISSVYSFVDTELSKKIYRFNEVLEEALELKAPHQVLTYLTEISSLFNRFYAESIIVDDKAPESGSRVGLTLVFAKVMKKGLEILGIPVPEKM